jgi:hypothetical protein
LLLNAIEGAVPEQIVIVDGVAVATGVGFTLTVTVIGVPGQPFADGVTVYTADPAVDPVALMICAIDEPEPDDAPEAPV